MKITIFWFRRDLRLEDNTALFHALRSGLPVLPLFIFDQQILQDLPKDDARVSFIYQKIQLLNEQLKAFKASIMCKYGNPLSIFKELMTTYDIEAVFYNRDYQPEATKRDEKVEKLLSSNNIQLYKFKDQVIFETLEVAKQDGSPYTVYTPYKNKWRQLYAMANILPVASAAFKNYLQEIHPLPKLNEIGFHKSDIAVENYDLSQIHQYGEKRDFPAASGTSLLGPHLRFGTIGIRTLVKEAWSQNEVFVNELIWREFFMQIMYNFPHVLKSSFKTKYDQIAWLNNEQDFERWCTGTTGYPLVDAGMRQLNLTGYMHNRVRMVVASFLCKHLLIDWRWGEAYFAEKLLDYEQSSNNGNWQWAAGSGCDAAPYFRVFNPMTQIQKFDKDYQYIRQWIPNYTANNYIKPMIEHNFARQRAISTYRSGLANK